MRIFFTILALLIGLTAANAQIAGQNDPQFKAALAQWLDGDDLAALTALSELAKANNRAAQVLLGRVDFMFHTHSHITGEMNKKERNALMRAQGGLSGKSWLRIASADTPLAAAFLQANRVREKQGALTQLLSFNENVAALRLLSKIYYDIHGDDIPIILEALKNTPLPEHVRVFTAHFEMLQALENNTIQRSEAPNFYYAKFSEHDAFMWSSYTWVDLVGGRTTAADIDPYLVDNPAFAPLQRFCAAACAKDVPKCMRALNGTPVKGSLWLTISSPIESIVPVSDYSESPRATADLKRLIQATIFHPDWLKRYDQCAYQAVFAE